MITGMLWYDGNPHASLKSKIEAAVNYYRHKYQQEPTLCLVHPNMVKDEKIDHIDKLTVRAYHSVLPGHFWIGIEEST